MRKLLLVALLIGVAGAAPGAASAEVAVEGITLCHEGFASTVSVDGEVAAEDAPLFVENGTAVLEGTTVKLKTNALERGHQAGQSLSGAESRRTAA
jgi:hypothetical protein